MCWVQYPQFGPNNFWQEQRNGTSRYYLVTGCLDLYLFYILCILSRWSQFRPLRQIYKYRDIYKVGPKPPHEFRSDLSGVTPPAIVSAAGHLRPSVHSGPGHYKRPGRFAATFKCSHLGVSSRYLTGSCNIYFVLQLVRLALLLIKFGLLFTISFNSPQFADGSTTLCHKL